MPILQNFKFYFFAIFWQVNIALAVSAWMQPSYPGENYEVTSTSSGNFGNNYYTNFTYYGNAGEYGPVVYNGNGDDGFNSAFDEGTKAFKRTAVTINIVVIGVVVTTVLIIVCCFCIVYQLVNKSRDHGRENHLNLGKTQGNIQSSSNTPMATVPDVAENINGHSYHHTSGLSCDNNNKICQTGFAGHDNSHTVSCVPTATEVPTAVAVG